MEELYLTAVIPPSNVQEAMDEKRTILFRSFGSVSARALPLSIPLALTLREVKRGSFPERLYQPPCCLNRGVGEKDGVFFALPDCGEFFEELARLIGEDAGPIEGIPRVISVLSGCFICSEALGIDLCAVGGVLGKGFAPSFASSVLSCMRLSIEAPGNELTGIAEQVIWEKRIGRSTG